MMLDPIAVEQLFQELAPIDRHLGTWVLRGRVLESPPNLQELATPEAAPFWAAALVNAARRCGHSRLKLGDFPVSEVLGKALPDAIAGITVGEILPDFSIVKMRKAGKSPGLPADPMFYFDEDGETLTFARLHRIEDSMANWFAHRLKRPVAPMGKLQQSVFAQLFPKGVLEKNPWQGVACVCGLRQPVSVITGGPGTGKTTTTAALTVLLLAGMEEGCGKIHLAAPTGKAADRMRESFAEAVVAVLKKLDPAIRGVLEKRWAELGTEAVTLHHLLGKGYSGQPRYDSRNPLPAGVVLVDEASMIDLELFHQLVNALDDSCRLVLLGDADQLEAVETGSVFRDLCSRGKGRGSLNCATEDFRNEWKSLTGLGLPVRSAPVPLLQDSITELEVSYRFSEDSPVGQLAQRLKRERRVKDCSEFPVIRRLGRQTLDDCVDFHADYGRALQKKTDPAYWLSLLNERRILCPARSGKLGVDSINRHLCRTLLGADSAEAMPVSGMPFLVNQNDRETGVWNGDCGVFAENDHGELRAWLPSREGGLRELSLSRISHWEPAFAITIHKSQGSEYRQVRVVLPAEKRRVPGWSLVYTAVTRAKESIELWVDPGLIDVELADYPRISGLSKMLFLKKAGKE